MPIYNDNRRFLFYPNLRDMIVEGFVDMILHLCKEDMGEEVPVIAGTATAGIPWGSYVADKDAKKPFIYIRDKPKDHGLRNRIEGIDAGSDLNQRNTIVIEDLFSTGGSSASAVQGVRDANGVCNYCFSIFTYGFDRATQEFDKLDPPVKTASLLTYDVLLKVAKNTGYIDSNKLKMLEEWRADPFRWGAMYGFPKVEK